MLDSSRVTQSKMKLPVSLPGMNLKTLLSSVGINLSDVEAQAKNVVAEAKKQIESLHTKIDALTASEAKLQADMKALHEKFDALLRVAANQSLSELITNGHGIDNNRGNSNGSSGNATTNGGK